MTIASRAPVGPDGGQGDGRARIAAAASDLFTGQGYERTTVDAIAERAGVARRTFFRYFRSKDDVIFPDHARLAAAVEAHLAAIDDLPPVRAVCSGARLVFRSYVEDPPVAVQRYRLAGSVPALRDREIASVSQYTRLFSRYLRGRLGGAGPSHAAGPFEGAGSSDGAGPPHGAVPPDALLYCDVVAASVVAAHNAVLRDWLRGGGVGDPTSDLDRAFAWVAERFEGRLPGGAAADPAPGAPGAAEDVVVAVFRAGESVDDVVERISRSL